MYCVKTFVFISNQVVFTPTVKLEAVLFTYVRSNQGVFTLPPNVPVELTSKVPVNVLFPANDCVPVVTTPLALVEALAIVIEGVVVPFATDIGKVPVTFVTVPVFVALNVPLDKDNPVPKVI